MSKAWGRSGAAGEGPGGDRGAQALEPPASSVMGSGKRGSPGSRQAGTPSHPAEGSLPGPPIRSLSSFLAGNLPSAPALAPALSPVSEDSVSSRLCCLESSRGCWEEPASITARGTQGSTQLYFEIISRVPLAPKEKLAQTNSQETPGRPKTPYPGGGGWLGGRCGNEQCLPAEESASGRKGREGRETFHRSEGVSVLSRPRWGWGGGASPARGGRGRIRS